jgi:preprotein translocase subunit SecD
VYDAPKTNLHLGLDLSGGTRVILKPKEKVSEEDLTLIIDNIKQRLNVYGLSDIIVRSARDLSGQDYIVVEIAGANKDEVRELLAQQGKFEAKIGNDTVFQGGKDITYVCRSAECSGIDRQRGCGDAVEGQICFFSFQITLSPDAAERQASITKELDVRIDQGGNYLSKPLTLYLDDEQVDELQIAADLKGRAATSILITGSGVGPTRQAAAQDAITNMKKLQTVLVTGSLPVELEIVKSDGISPALGKEFITNAIMLGIFSILAVAIVLVIRYRELLISIPIIITMLSEVLITLGFAAWVGWNLDLAAIAAIVIAIGSGVDDQIVIIDETLRGGVEKDTSRTWKEKIGRAFFIVLASYFTLAAAMIPLFFAGAGLLRGFALTTLVGITVGVLITRPAFANIVEHLVGKDDE